MDTSPTPEPSSPAPALRPLPQRLRLGDVVLYHSQGMPVRAAHVGHIERDGRTAHLIVLLEGDADNPATSSLTRQLWANGQWSRVRGAVPYVEDDASGVRHWTFRD